MMVDILDAVVWHWAEYVDPKSSCSLIWHIMTAYYGILLWQHIQNIMAAYYDRQHIMMAYTTEAQFRAVRQKMAQN